MMKKSIYIITLLCTFWSSSTMFAKTKEEEEESQLVDNSLVIDRIGNNDIEITLPSVIFTFTEAEIKLKFKNPNHTKLLVNNNRIDFIINGQDQILTFVNGEASFKHKFDTDKKLSVFTEDFSFNTTVTAYPLWAFLVPLIFIVLWLIIKKIKQ